MSFMPANRHILRLAAVALALILASPAAHAQQPSVAALSTAKEIVNTTGTTLLFSPLVSGVIEQAKNLFLQQNPSLSKDLGDVSNQLRTDLTPRLEELNNEVARLYATRFTEAELKDILAFYKTEAGKKMLTEQPVVVENSMKFAQDWANKLSEEVMAKMRVEMKKKGHDL